MKKLFLIMLLGGLLWLTSTQGQTIPVVSGTAYFYADSISTTITLNKNEFLAMIYIDASRTASIYPQIYNTGKAAWYMLDDDGSQYSTTIADSSENYAIPMKPTRFLSAKQIRFIIDNDPADTLELPYEKRPY